MEPVDTTGSRNVFMAFVLQQFLIKNKPIKELTEINLREMLMFAIVLPYQYRKRVGSEQFLL